MSARLGNVIDNESTKFVASCFNSGIDNFFKSAGELIVSRMVVIAAYFLVSPFDNEISDFD